jgi:hypothetical protein
MQTVVEREIELAMRHHLKPIILLELIQASEDGAKRFYAAGETLYVAQCEKPASFMDCDAIHISCQKPFKSAIDSWKSKNGVKAFYFTMKRSIGGYC